MCIINMPLKSINQSNVCSRSIETESVLTEKEMNNVNFFNIVFLPLHKDDMQIREVFHFFFFFRGGACGVMVIVVGNRHGDTSSNLGRD